MKYHIDSTIYSRVGASDNPGAVQSGLVTDHLVPMLFSSKAASVVDVITEFGGLADTFPTPANA